MIKFRVIFLDKSRGCITALLHYGIYLKIVVLLNLMLNITLI